MAIPNSLIGAAGEYMVAAELLRRGWLATITIKNAPRTDVLAQHYESNQVVSIQTKTTGGAGGWLVGIGEEAPARLDNEWLVLVSLGGRAATPRFWLMPRNHVAAYLWVGHRRWLEGVKRDGMPRKDTPMRGVSAADIADYEGKWEWLQDPTSSVPYSLLPSWVDEGLRDPNIGLRCDHPDLAMLGAVGIAM